MCLAIWYLTVYLSPMGNEIFYSYRNIHILSDWLFIWFIIYLLNFNDNSFSSGPVFVLLNVSNTHFCLEGKQWPTIMLQGRKA